MNPSRRGHRHTIGITRRELLQVGYSGLLGMGLPGLCSAKPVRTTRKARSVLLIFLTGGASQLETFDLKPEAPAEIRGNFRPIDTRVPGIRICEHLPRLAARTDKLAIVRSMAHRNFDHLSSTHMILTGAVIPGISEEAGGIQLSRDNWPCYAAGLNYLRPRTDSLPAGVTLPNPLIEGPLIWPGQHAGFLGPKHDPWQIKQDPNAADFRIDNLRLPDGFGVERLRERQALLVEVNRSQEELRRLAGNLPLSDRQQQAFNLLTSNRVGQAFEIEREAPKVRERYGRHLFGQSLLLARRLIEAGVPIVQANMGIVQTWDSHNAIFDVLKDRLLPPLDLGVSALLDDLEFRGLLEETLVVMMGEFGRTPKIGLSGGASVPGRDHWPYVFPAVFAGCGVRAGQVIGRSDTVAGYPSTTPYSPADLGATVYHALGVEPTAEVRDRQGRPVQLNRGQVMQAVFSGAGE